MGSRDERRISVRNGKRSLFGGRGPAELIGVEFRSPDHFTRLWPTGSERAPDAVFLFTVLPIRLLALALLWATSAPGRILVAVAILLALSLVV